MLAGWLFLCLLNKLFFNVFGSDSYNKLVIIYIIGEFYIVVCKLVCFLIKMRIIGVYILIICLLWKSVVL